MTGKCYDVNGNEIDHLTQWDLNQVICLDSEVTSPVPEIHFCGREHTLAYVTEGSIRSGRVSAEVPNILLQDRGPITIYLYYKPGDNSGKSSDPITLQVYGRQKPSDYYYTDNTDEILDLRTQIEGYQEQIDELGEIKLNKDSPSVSRVLNIEGRAGEMAINFIGDSTQTVSIRPVAAEENEPMSLVFSANSGSPTRLSGIESPTGEQDAANKDYVDSKGIQFEQKSGMLHSFSPVSNRVYLFDSVNGISITEIPEHAVFELIFSIPSSGGAIVIPSDATLVVNGVTPASTVSGNSTSYNLTAGNYEVNFLGNSGVGVRWN